MTDDKALAARIRKEVCNCHICGLCGWKPKRAADRIEALSAENERLRELLNHVADQADHDCETMWITDIIRAALGDAK